MQVSRALVVGVVIAMAACTTTTSPPSPSATSPQPTRSQSATSTPAETVSATIAPTENPSPASVAPLPVALQYRWVGETRTIPDAAPPVVESTMQVKRDEWTFYATEDGSHPLAVSTPSIDSEGNLRLLFKSGTAPCTEGDEGTYAFDLSSTERALDLEVVNDPCTQRVDAMSGSWTRSACPTNHLCLGDLDPGQHVSVIYTPLVPFADWHYTYGRFGYTVPDGWTNPEDNQDGYVLLPRNAPDGAGIYVFSDVLAHKQAHDPVTHYCVAEPEPEVSSNWDAIYDWIKSLDGLVVTNAQKGAPVGELNASTMDLAVDPAWTRTCGWAGEQPGRPLFVNPQTNSEEGLDWGISGDIRQRLILVPMNGTDLVHDPDGGTHIQRARTLLIDIEAPDQATFDALLPEAMPIVESFEFEP